MNTQFDALENRLNALRPTPLPAPARRHILSEMERSSTAGRSIFRVLDRQHFAGVPVTIAAALLAALIMGWNWLPRIPRPLGGGHTTELTSSAASLASWGTTLASVYPIGENSVAVLRSPSILTNIQIRH